MHLNPRLEKNTHFLQELQHNLVIVPKISALRRKSVIFISFLIVTTTTCIDHCTGIAVHCETATQFIQPRQGCSFVKQVVGAEPVKTTQSTIKILEFPISPRI